MGAAKKAALTFMVGGEEEAYQRAKPLLECMGKNVVHCGPNGTGLAAKICNNMLLGITMIGASEALQLGLRCVCVCVCVCPWTSRRKIKISS